MGKGSLEQVVAGRVVVAIRAREHVLVSPGQCDALRSELEQVIAPSIRDWRANEANRQACDDADRDSQPRHCAQGSSATVDHHRGMDARAERIAHTITEQLHSSDHVDDIYAADGAIWRDTLTAVRETLLGFMRGELPLIAQRPGGLTIHLDEFGDTARFISGALDAAALECALQQAATRVGASLDTFRADDRSATFTFDGDHGGHIIALEEAVVAALLRLAEGDSVQLPAIEQLLSLSSGRLDAPHVQAALADACARARQHTGCVARCQVLDSATLRVRLIPLTQASADRLDDHYDEFLGELQQALVSSADADAASPPERRTERPSAPASKRYAPEERKSSQRSVVGPHAGARKSQAKPRTKRVKRGPGGG